jgi:hypothetical protein
MRVLCKFRPVASILGRLHNTEIYAEMSSNAAVIKPTYTHAYTEAEVISESSFLLFEFIL